MKKEDIRMKLFDLIGTIKDLELEVKDLKKEVEKDLWYVKAQQEAENKALWVNLKIGLWKSTKN